MRSLNAGLLSLRETKFSPTAIDVKVVPNMSIITCSYQRKYIVFTNVTSLSMQEKNQFGKL